MSRRECPSPEKVRFTSFGEAQRAMRKMPLGGPIRAYRCKGHWHLTGNPASKPTVR